MTFTPHGKHLIVGAEEAFCCYGYPPCESRAAFLDLMTDEIEARAEAVTETCPRDAAGRPCAPAPESTPPPYRRPQWSRPVES